MPGTALVELEGKDVMKKAIVWYEVQVTLPVIGKFIYAAYGDDVGKIIFEVLSSARSGYAVPSRTFCCLGCCVVCSCLIGNECVFE